MDDLSQCYNVLTQHLGELGAKIDSPLAVLGFQVLLDNAAFCFLHNFQRAEILGEVLDLKTQRLTSAEWAASG